MPRNRKDLTSTSTETIADTIVEVTIDVLVKMPFQRLSIDEVSQIAEALHKIVCEELDNSGCIRVSDELLLPEAIEAAHIRPKFYPHLPDFMVWGSRISGEVECQVGYYGLTETFSISPTK